MYVRQGLSGAPMDSLRFDAVAIARELAAEREARLETKAELAKLRKSLAKPYTKPAIVAEFKATKKRIAWLSSLEIY